MDFGKNLNNLMQEAQKMQQRMLDAQKELTDLSVYGESGGGMVKIKMNGRHDVSEVKINPSLLDDVEMLEGLVAAAINAAVRNVEKISQDKIKQLTSGLNLPTDFMGAKDDKEDKE